MLKINAKLARQGVGSRLPKIRPSTATQRVKLKDLKK